MTAFAILWEIVCREHGRTQSCLDADYIIRLAVESISHGVVNVDSRTQKRDLDSRVAVNYGFIGIGFYSQTRIMLKLYFCFLNRTNGVLNGEEFVLKLHQSCARFLGKVCLEWEKVVDTIAPIWYPNCQSKNY